MEFYCHIIMTLEDLCLMMEAFRPGCCRAKYISLVYDQAKTCRH